MPFIFYSLNLQIDRAAFHHPTHIFSIEITCPTISEGVFLHIGRLFVIYAPIDRLYVLPSDNRNA